MKNFIIILLIFAIPLGLYAFFNEKAEQKALPQANAVEVVNKAKVVKFYSPLCSECKEVAKEMTGLKEKYQDNVIFEEINVSEQTKINKKMIKNYNISLVPTLVFIYKDGNVSNKVEGFINKSEIEANLDKIK